MGYCGTAENLSGQEGGQSLLQHVPGAEQKAFSSRNGHFQRFGYFLVRHVLKAAELDGQARLFRQGCNGVIHGLLKLRLL